MIYKVKLSKAARLDILNYRNAIYYEYDLPKTAAKIILELKRAIKSLCKNPTQNVLRSAPWYLKYGLFVRRINFKSRAIIYTVNQDVVYIHRIASQNEITGV